MVNENFRKGIKSIWENVLLPHQYFIRHEDFPCSYLIWSWYCGTGVSHGLISEVKNPNMQTLFVRHFTDIQHQFLKFNFLSIKILWNHCESLKYVVERFWSTQWTSDKPILIACVVYISTYNPKGWGVNLNLPPVVFPYYFLIQLCFSPYFYSISIILW